MLKLNIEIILIDFSINNFFRFIRFAFTKAASFSILCMCTKYHFSLNNDRRFSSFSHVVAFFAQTKRTKVKSQMNGYHDIESSSPPQDLESTYEPHALKKSTTFPGRLRSSTLSELLHQKERKLVRQSSLDGDTMDFVFSQAEISDSAFEQKYELGDVLGEGASSCVRIGRERATGQEFAVKMMSVSVIAKHRNLLREISLLRRLNHPNIIKLHEVLLTPQTVYIIMEL
jgi:hypothetical protein